MGTKNFIIVILMIALIAFNIQITYGQATRTVNYNIPSWENATGSFTFQIGTSVNKESNKIEGYLTVFNNDEVVIEITTEIIAGMLKKLEEEVENDFLNKDKAKYEKVKENLKRELLELKTLLSNHERMLSLIDALETNTELSGIIWNYTVSTIWNNQALVTGTLD